MQFMISQVFFLATAKNVESTKMSSKKEEFTTITLVLWEIVLIACSFKDAQQALVSSFM